MLKAELHTHVKGDREDKQIKYSVFDLIDEAKRQNFDVIAITCHNTLFNDRKAEEYASRKGMILIFGIEKTIKRKHVLIYDPTKEIMEVKTFGDLQKYKTKNPDSLIIAPHPYNVFPFCLKKKIMEYPSLFDAWEHSFFYTTQFNPNKKLIIQAKSLKKPMVGNSDVHYLKDLGLTYTLIDSKKNKKEIFDAIKKGKTKVVTHPLSFFNFIARVVRIVFNIFIGKQ